MPFCLVGVDETTDTTNDTKTSCSAVAGCSSIPSWLALTWLFLVASVSDVDSHGWPSGIVDSTVDVQTGRRSLNIFIE